ncbi:MAG: ABC transporter permease [Planctomycetota bacterium]|jgi:putative ABC transport system permease protein|nr:ABC transporter permease [Planctomycetota bacterium]
MKVLRLAWAALWFYRRRNGLLLLALVLCGALPLSLHVLVQRAEQMVHARAVATPLVVAARGSALEQVLAGAYFSDHDVGSVPAGLIDELNARTDVVAVPLLLGFHAQQAPIVGTNPDYLRQRGLGRASGRWFMRPGECVVGADLAQARGLAPGSVVVSSPESAFNLAGSYPIEMDVVGVLAPHGSPDDGAVLCDVRTTWAIAGYGHGHQDAASADASLLLQRDGKEVVVNAAMPIARRIDAGSGMHLHGDPAALPISLALVFPATDKAGTLLRGAYLADDAPYQVIEPAAEITELFATVAVVEWWVQLGLAAAFAATLLVAVLVMTLSLRQRDKEFRTMRLLGASRSRIAGIIAGELGMLLMLAAGGMVVVTVAVHMWAGSLIVGVL